MATYSFKQYGKFSREYEIIADTQEDARKMFRGMSESERDYNLVFDADYIEYLDVEEVESNE